MVVLIFVVVLLECFVFVFKFEIIDWDFFGRLLIVWGGGGFFDGLIFVKFWLYYFFLNDKRGCVDSGK